MKKAIAILLCIVAILGLAACGTTPSSNDTPSNNTPSNNTPSNNTPANNTPSNNTPADNPGTSTRDTVYVGTDSDTGSLDPYVMSGNGVLIIRACYSQALWENAEDGDSFSSKCVLAESVDTISDTEYLIHLRKGVTFSNGSEFKANDVLFTFNYVANETNRGSYIASVDVEKMVAEDDYTVRMFLKKYDKTQMVSLRSIPMLDEETFDPETCGQRPIGTGPYVVTDYVVNSSVTLEARDDYWGEKPAIKKVVFKFIPEASQKVNAIQTGDVDMLAVAPDNDAAYIDSLDNARAIYKSCMNQVCLTYNACKGSPLESKEARWAVSYAVNAQGIIDVALAGNGQVAHVPFNASAIDYSDDLKDLHDTYKTGYNMELAKKYAEESGLVGKTVRLVTNGTDVYATAAQIIEQALKEIGVNAEVQNYDQATVRNMIAGPDDWEVYVSWTSNPSEVGLDIIYSQISKFNRCHFDHDEALFNSFKERGEELLGTSDEAKYHDLFKSYLKDFEDQCFVFGIADTNWIMAANESLQGVKNFGHAYDYVADWYFVD